MATIQFELQLNPAYRYAVWCYVPNEALTDWEPPYVCEHCFTEADAQHYAHYMKKTYQTHKFDVLPTGATPRETV